MLAPRKKLWASPIDVVKEAIRFLDIKSNDVVFDIGCGDGDFILECARTTVASSVVGVEVEQARCQRIQAIIDSEKMNDRCSVICQNALTVDFSKVSTQQ